MAVKQAKDTYGKVVDVGDTVVFSWGGKLSLAKVASVKLGVRAILTVYPLDYNGKAYGYGAYDAKNREGAVTATVQNAQSVVKVEGCGCLEKFDETDN